MYVSFLLKRNGWLMLLHIVFLIAFPVSVLASGLTVTDSSDNEINVEITPAQGELLVIWLLDHDEERPQFENMLNAINQNGIEVWRVDLLADYFLPRSSENVRTLSGDGVAAIIREAHQRSDKKIVLASYDRMPLPLLRGARVWQQAGSESSRLIGAILFYPNLFGPPPVAGEDPELDPVVEATNIPVTIYQPENGTHRWRLGEMMDGLQEGGSPVFTYLVPDVRDWFFMHLPGEDPAETVATAKVPENILAFSRLMEAQPKPVAAAPLTGAEDIEARVQELVVLNSKKPAPDFDLLDISGKRSKLADYRETVLLINFWATWCPPCVDELPSLNDLTERYKDRNFSVVSIDFREPKEVIQKFSEQLPVDFPILLDSDGRVSWQWKVFSFPSSYLIDQHGRIRYSVNRAIDWNTPGVWNAIDKLLNEQ